jgi:hypothetical protein
MLGVFILYPMHTIWVSNKEPTLEVDTFPKHCKTFDTIHAHWKLPDSQKKFRKPTTTTTTTTITVWAQIF